MNLRKTFQSIIALHQEEIPMSLYDRALQLPINEQNIVTVTGVRRCGKSSLMGLTINRLLAAGVAKEQILYVAFDDERLSEMQVSDCDEILQAYREMYRRTRQTLWRAVQMLTQKLSCQTIHDCPKVVPLHYESE